VHFGSCVISDPYTFVSGLPFRLGSGHLLMLESEDITLVYYSSDPELKRNKLWSVDTVLDVTMNTCGI